MKKKRNGYNLIYTTGNDKISFLMSAISRNLAIRNYNVLTSFPSHRLWDQPIAQELTKYMGQQSPATALVSAFARSGL